MPHDDGMAPEFMAPEPAAMTLGTLPTLLDHLFRRSSKVADEPIRVEGVELPGRWPSSTAPPRNADTGATTVLVKRAGEATMRTPCGEVPVGSRTEENLHGGSSDAGLEPYVAPVALEWLRTEPDRRHRRFEATLAFVDLSGSTALTERLSVQGKAGAEEVADILGSTFADLLDVSAAQGGEMLKWGGDASLLLFRGPGSPARAARAARGMSQLMARIGNVKTTAGRVHLGVSAGVHTGDIDLYLLGERHRELVVTGPAASAVGELEHAADAGEVLIAPETARHLDARAVGARKGPGFLLLPDVDLHGDDEKESKKESVVSSALTGAERTTGAGAERLLSATVCHHLLSGEEPAEHRFASVAFVQFSGVDALTETHGPLAVAAALEPVISSTQEAAERYGVTFHYSDIAPGGGKILLTGGLPIVRGSDEERLLRAALAIVHGHKGPLELRAGLNAGRFFVHDAGTRLRRVYAFAGDSVNLGARVMAHAEPFQVLATDSFLERVRSPLRTTPIPPFMAKGKSEPVITSTVEEVLDDRRAAPSSADGWRFVGRQHELTVLERLAHRAEGGSGSVADIVAEPGFGKSTLVSEAAGRWGLRTLQVICESYGDATPYRPFRHLLLAVLGVRHDSGHLEVLGALDRVAGAEHSEVRRWLPLLGALFDIPLPSTPEVDQLDPKFRRERLEEAALLLLDQLVTEPVAFIFEDLHAADDSTRSLVTRMAVTAADRPWLIVVTRRPEAERWYPAQGIAVHQLQL